MPDVGLAEPSRTGWCCPPAGPFPMPSAPAWDSAALPGSGRQAPVAIFSLRSRAAWNTLARLHEVSFDTGGRRGSCSFQS